MLVDVRTYETEVAASKVCQRYCLLAACW